MRKTLAVFALGCLLMAGLFVAFATSATSGTERVVIPAHELRKAFADDQSAAEAKYLGKTVLVEGIVLSTGMSKYLTPNVILSDRADGQVQVICVLPRLDAHKLSDFTPGQKTTMSGRVYRLSERGVVLKECTVAE